MKIVNGKKYRIKGESKYFKDKYGTPNPIIVIEDTDTEVFGGSWGFQKGNPACMLYGMRAGFGNIPIEKGQSYYGHIPYQNTSLGELVHETELEEA